MPEKRESRILVIDSHPQTATSISTILRNEGYATEEAYNLKSAEAALKENGFSLIVIDANINFNTLLDSKHPKIIVTGFDTPKDKIKKFKNVIGVLKKPISKDELLTLIKKLGI